MKKIENHPSPTICSTRSTTKQRPTTRLVLRSREWFRDMDNVELFEWFETDPKMQCKECLSYWSEDVVYCLLRTSVERKCSRIEDVIQYRSDLPWIPNYVIKKRRPHDHRYGKKLHNKKNIIKSIIWKRDASRRNIKGSTIAFWSIPNFVYPSSKHDRDEEVCIKMDELADKDFSHYMT